MTENNFYNCRNAKATRKPVVTIVEAFVDLQLQLNFCLQNQIGK